MERTRDTQNDVLIRNLDFYRHRKCGPQKHRLEFASTPLDLSELVSYSFFIHCNSAFLGQTALNHKIGRTLANVMYMYWQERGRRIELETAHYITFLEKLCQSIAFYRESGEIQIMRVMSAIILLCRMENKVQLPHYNLRNKNTST